MTTRSRSSLFLALGMLLLPGSLLAMIEIYPEPQVISATSQDETLSCQELDSEISGLLALTYSLKPGFYQDSYHGAALWGGTVYTGLFYGFLGYSMYVDQREEDRIGSSRNRIELLRRLKARKRCFET